jgi:S-adenosylmethionine synthetase
MNKQSPDIAGGVHVGKDDMATGVCDPGIMFEYANDDTADCMPVTHSMAMRLGKTSADVCKSSELWWLRPDGNAQITIEYLQKADSSVEPKEIDTVVIHAEPSKAALKSEFAGYSGPDMTAPIMEEMNNLIVEHVVEKTLKDTKLKSGEAAITLYGDHTHLHISPSGKFIIGNPQGDAGLMGRKVIIDTYSGWSAHGGGAFSSKDSAKVDLSAAYSCRQMAKSVMKSCLCKCALVQLSSAIAMVKLLSLFVETSGVEQDDITNVIKVAFDWRPSPIAMCLALREPKYQETAAYCHSRREPYTKDGPTYFQWGNAKKCCT